MIYFIADCEFVKVGYGKDIGKRVTTLQTANPRPFTLLASCEGDEKLELLLHKHLPARVNRDREWFYITPNLLQLVADVNARGGVALQEYIEASKAAKRTEPVDWEARDKEFSADVANVITGLKEEHGFQVLCEIMGCTEAMIHRYCSGKSLPISVKLIRLFRAFPEHLQRFPAFKHITNMILQAEGVRA